MTPVIVVALAIPACAFAQPQRIKPAGSRHLEGWHKLFALVAVVLAVLIIINPEFLALGLLGDTAFFDLLVLALSLQLQGIVLRLWRVVATVFSRNLRWLMAPSPGLPYLLAASALILENVGSALQNVVHRLSS